MTAARSEPIPFPAPQNLIGRSVGRFVIRYRLGAGGMGEVYYAEDPTLHRPVALKRVTHKLGSNPEARQHILREAQRASALSSEHIATIHDVLEEDGELFLVMEYVEGETLRQRLRGSMTLEQFFAVAMQCAEALLAAHEHGIIHCDVKPENIMLTPAGQVKILNFGLAKHLPRSDQSSTLDSDLVGGTPSYMAPEVLLGKLPDGGTDIFSLGVVLYEMLTLKNPFFGSSFVATSERILHDQPASIRACNPQVSEELEAVVMKAMAKSPTQRYANARDLLEDLRRVRAGASPAKLTPVVRSRKGKRWLVAGVALLAVVASAFAIYRWTHRHPVLVERGWVLIADFETSGDNAIPDKGVREGLTIALQQSRYVNVFPRARAYEVLQRMKKEGAPRIDEALGREICQRENLQVLLSGSIERMGQVFQITVRALDPAQGSLLFAERERFDRADQFFEKADRLAKKMREDLGESLDRIEKNSRPLAKVSTASLEALQLYSRATDALDRGRNEEVEGLLKTALQLDPDFAMAHLRLGQYYQAMVGKNERAVAELERAYELRQAVTDREQRGIEAGYYNLQEQYEDEAQSLKVLVSLYPDDEDAHQALAGAYYDLDQIDSAIGEVREVLRVNPSSASAYGKLVFYMVRNGQAEAALGIASEATQRGVDSPQIHWGLGLAQLNLGDVTLARQEFQQIGRGTATERELQEMDLVMVDLYAGKLDAAKAQLVRQNEVAAPRNGGLQTIRRYLLGRIDLSQDHVREAKLEADRILQEPAAGLQIYDLLNAGILYARAGRIDRAREVARRLDDARRSVPTSWSQSCFHNLEGEIGIALATPEDAARSFAAAAQEYPQAFSYAGLARAYQTQQQWELAVHDWEQALRRKAEILQDGYPPDLAYAHLQLARAYRRLRQFNLARSHYEEMLRMWQDGDDLPMLTDARRESKSTPELPPTNDPAENRTTGPAVDTKPE
jgi:eukaryotic-like serine/threonine-protein kinase